MNEKQAVAIKAVEFVETGMILGIGTGSTVNYFINALADKIKDGLKITAVSTSAATTKLAESLGIRITSQDEVEKVDLTIDGADEVDAQFNGIKGGGGALLFEKIVAKASQQNIWIVDSSKIVKQLGKFPLPVEVTTFGAYRLLKYFDKLGYRPIIRKINSQTFITDSGNYIIDLHLDVIKDPANLETELKLITGVVECGLFINIANRIIAGYPDRIEITNK
jgi:ribose 5-phosphate isomerase A